MPAWLFLTPFILLAVGFGLTVSAWMLEPRKYPSQRKAISWGILFIALSALLLWGVVWAYLLPAEFEGKLAFTLVLTRWLVSGSLYGALTTPLPLNA